jgi:hypothetical protein
MEVHNSIRMSPNQVFFMSSSNYLTYRLSDECTIIIEALQGQDYKTHINASTEN